MTFRRFERRMELAAYAVIGHVTVAIAVLFLLPVLALDVWRRWRGYD